MRPTSQGVILRHATPRDLPAIAANTVAFIWETEHRAADPATVRRGVGAMLADPAGGFYLMAEERGVAAGQCMVTSQWSDWRNGTFWWIQNAYVRKSWRRRGIFSQLVRAVENEARNRPDVIGIRLLTPEENTAARAACVQYGMKEARYALFEIETTTD